MVIRLCVFWLLIFLIPWQVMSLVQGQDAGLNLEQHNFEETPVVFVDGKWEFYWNRLISPGDFSTFTSERVYVDYPYLWTSHDYPSFGAATFRTEVKLPEKTPQLSLLIPDAYSSYSLFINGVLFANKIILTKRMISPITWFPSSITTNNTNHVPEYKVEILKLSFTPSLTK